MSDEGLYVEVYRNLHKNCLSIRHKGKVIGYVTHIVLRDAKLVVQQAGNARVRREGRKNVHAVVRGYVTTSTFPGQSKIKENAVYYDPYQHTSFVMRKTGEPVYEAKLAFICLGQGFFII